MKYLAGVFVLLSALALISPPVSLAEQRIDIESELRLLEQGKTLPRRIPGARFRVAVFTYEDPSGTDLGNAMSALVSAHILMNSRVSSIGVLRYEGRLAPTRESRLSYFDGRPPD